MPSQIDARLCMISPDFNDNSGEGQKQIMLEALNNFNSASIGEGINSLVSLLDEAVGSVQAKPQQAQPVKAPEISNEIRDVFLKLSGQGFYVNQIT